VSGPGLTVNTYQPLLGTRVQIAVGADDEQAAAAADEAAVVTIRRLTAVFSVFDPGSELCRWRTGELDLGFGEASGELALVLAEAEHWHRSSAGAFHPACGLLRRRWLDAEREGRLPDRDELAALADGLRRLPYRTRGGPGEGSEFLVERIADCSQVDLNALAKGHLVDRAVEAALAVDGVHTVIVDAGGDLRHAGAGEVGVRIEDPLQPYDNAPALDRLTVADAAVATSGVARRGFTVDEHRFGHVIDPRSGWPVTATVSATVRAATARTADALATIAMVLPAAQALSFVDDLTGAACLLVAADGSRHCSADWPAATR